MVTRKYTRKKVIQNGGSARPARPAPTAPPRARRPAPPPPPGADPARARRPAPAPPGADPARPARPAAPIGPPPEQGAYTGQAPVLPGTESKIIPQEPGAKEIGLVHTLPFIGLAGATIGTTAALPKMALGATIHAPIGVAGTILSYPVYKYYQSKVNTALKDLEKLGGYNINRLKSKLDEFNANIKAVEAKQQTIIEAAQNRSRYIYPGVIKRKTAKYNQQLAQLEKSKRQYLNSEIKRHTKLELNKQITNSENTQTKQNALLKAMQNVMSKQNTNPIVSHKATELAQLSAAAANLEARLKKYKGYFQMPYTSLKRGLRVGKTAMSFANSQFVGDSYIEPAASKKARFFRELYEATGVPGVPAVRKFFAKSGQQGPVPVAVVTDPVPVLDASA